MRTEIRDICSVRLLAPARQGIVQFRILDRQASDEAEQVLRRYKGMRLGLADTVNIALAQRRSRRPLCPSMVTKPSCGSQSPRSHRRRPASAVRHPVGEGQGLAVMACAWVLGLG